MVVFSCALCCLSRFLYSSLPALFFFLIIRRPPIPTLFPYTTLFRSTVFLTPSASSLRVSSGIGRAPAGSRSEEHTSELQSLRHLVCRLLLEKKNSRLGAE